MEAGAWTEMQNVTYVYYRILRGEGRGDERRVDERREGRRGDGCHSLLIVLGALPAVQCYSLVTNP